MSTRSRQREWRRGKKLARVEEARRRSLDGVHFYTQEEFRHWYEWLDEAWEHWWGNAWRIYQWEAAAQEAAADELEFRREAARHRSRREAEVPALPFPLLLRGCHP